MVQLTVEIQVVAEAAVTAVAQTAEEAVKSAAVEMVVQIVGEAVEPAAGEVVEKPVRTAVVEEEMGSDGGWET